MTTLVFSYSHADEALRNELEKHLSPLKRMGKIAIWHDRRIVPGQEFERQIDHYFRPATAGLFLSDHQQGMNNPLFTLHRIFTNYQFEIIDKKWAV